MAQECLDECPRIIGLKRDLVRVRIGRAVAMLYMGCFAQAELEIDAQLRQACENSDGCSGPVSVTNVQTRGILTKGFLGTDFLKVRSVLVDDIACGLAQPDQPG
jgi:hypothetical protein